MPVDVGLLQFKGFAVRPEDIQLGEAQAIEILLNRKGQAIPVNIRRRSVTITLRGLTSGEAQPFVNEASTTAINVINGSNGEKIVIGGIEIEQAILVNATPSGSTILNGTSLLETLQLEYHSLIFT